MERKFFGELFIACSNAPKLFDPIEEALDEIAVFVQMTIVLTRLGTALARGNDGLRTLRFNDTHKFISIIALIAHYRLRRQALDQGRRFADIGHLTLAQAHSQGILPDLLRCPMKPLPPAGQLVYTLHLMFTRYQWEAPGLTLHTYDMLNKSATMEPPHIPEVCELVLGWRANGASWAECARRLDECGIRIPAGSRWLFSNGSTNLARYFRG
jgi:hypothetical protein